MSKKWKVVNGKRVTYAMVAAVALGAHEQAYIDRGDRYSTPEEMHFIRQDPLAYDESVGEAIAAAFGYERFGDFKHEVLHHLRTW